MKIKKTIALLTALFALLVSCSDEFSSTEEESGNESKAVTIKVSMDNGSSRTALPEVNVESLSYLILRYSDSKTSESKNIIGEWNSVAEMTAKSLSFTTGTYTFSFYATNGASVFTDTKEYEIKEGENNLYFTPKLSITGTENNGKGNLEISMNCNPMKGTEQVINLVTCALYTLEGNVVPGCSEIALDLTSAGKCKYSKNDIQSGIYVAIFRFYGDTEKKLPLATYREYASIANGFTSKSTCTLSSTSEIFSINYELNGGQFADGYTTSGSYTRKGEEISLPKVENVSKTLGDREYKFYGWYDNPEFEGAAITSIPSGSTGDKTFYAKWCKTLTITFVKNDGSDTQATQTAMEGEAVALKTLGQLGLTSSRKFLGWVHRSDTHSIEKSIFYGDGDPVTIYDDLVLYGSWGALDITADSSKDTDGDGLSDYDEIKIYHTDPASTDTDGDGWTDKEELSLYNANTRTFSPLIADIPKLDIAISGIPKIEYKFTSSTSDGDSVSESISGGSSGSQSNSKSNARSHSETYSWSEKVTVKVSHECSVTEGPSFGLTVGGEQSFDHNSTNGDSRTYSESQSDGWSKSWSNGKSKSSGKSKTVSGGTLAIPIKFKNPGNIAYTIKNATISIYRIPTNKAVPLEMTSTVAGSYNITLAPGEETREYNLVATFSNPDKIEQLLKYSNGFTVSLAAYNITMSKDKSSKVRENDFTEALTEVNAKTATIYIDWGLNSGRTPKTYNVAVKSLYNTDATGLDDQYKETPLEYVLKEILKVPEAEGSGYTIGRGLINSFYGIKNNSAPKDGVWLIGHSRPLSSEEKHVDLYSTPYSKKKMSDIILQAGDEISIIYTVDSDGDGVPLHEERLRNTSDEKADTDGDGISDYDEIHGWYKENLDSTKYSPEHKVYTNPALSDSDGDGKPDAQDSDPMMPELSNDATLKTISYSTKANASFSEIKISTAETTEVTVPGTLEAAYIYLDAQSTQFFTEIKYSLTGTEFAELKKDTAIPLKIGQNKVYLKCTAPDERTEKEYTVNVNSNFLPLEKFSMNVGDSKNNGVSGEVSLSWNPYTDDRCDAKKYNGGYLLYIKREYSVREFDPPIADARREITTNLTTDFTGDKHKDKKEFVFRLDNTYLQHGGIAFTLLTGKYYSFYIYAFTESNTSDTYKYKCLVSKNIQTPKSAKGKLTFYAHYVEDLKDPEELVGTSYYWTITDTSNIGISASALNEKDTREWNHHSDTQPRYYAFGDGVDKFHTLNSRPLKFSESTKKITGEFSRYDNSSFSVTWGLKSGDSIVGIIKTEFNHSGERDDWNCKCFLTQLRFTSKNELQEEFTIKSGQRTEGKKWVIRDPSDEGYVPWIEFNWDLGWDYEEE